MEADYLSDSGNRYVTWCVFFFKQKTAYEMRISDWSSDVCSSDLAAYKPQAQTALASLRRSKEADRLQPWVNLKYICQRRAREGRKRRHPSCRTYWPSITGMIPSGGAPRSPLSAAGSRIGRRKSSTASASSIPTPSPPRTPIAAISGRLGQFG